MRGWTIAPKYETTGIAVNFHRLLLAIRFDLLPTTFRRWYEIPQTHEIPHIARSAPRYSFMGALELGWVGEPDV